MPESEPIQALVDLGLTELEARIYAELLADPDGTGYRVAKALGKPAANVYKALESLEAKGAVLVEEGAARRYRPVPAEEFLGRLERRFARRRREAAAALARLPAPPGDQRIYQIRAVEELLDRSRRMLDEARDIVLVDIFPEPLAELRGEIARAAARGVEVVAKVYHPAEIPGARIVLEPDHHEVRSRWRGTWLNLHVDGRRLLYGMLDREMTTVIQSLWSESPVLATLLTFGFGYELAYTALKQQFARGADLETLRARFAANETYFAERIRPLAAAHRWYAQR